MIRRKRVLSKHPSHSDFRSQLPIIKGVNYVVRFGSSTELNDTVVKGGNRIEINPVKGIKNSANKLLMKQCFTRAKVKTANWGKATDVDHINSGAIQFRTDENGCEGLEYPIIAKSLYGSRGEGNYKLDNQAALEQWMKGKNLNNYIFEKFYTYTREYRLHVSKNGCFYACRKMLKEGTPDNQKWSRHDDNCVWIVEENEQFDKPVNWKSIVSDCVKAIQEIGLDVGAFDVKVQSSKDSKGRNRENPEYILIEINSAPSHGERTCVEYVKEVTKLIKEKYINN